METKRTYVITAAGGHIGGPVARGLLRAGHRVRALGRDPDRLKPLIELGATAEVGDVSDAGFVERAFRGADAALLVVPPNPRARDFRRYFGDIGVNYANAARASSLQSAVFISCHGTHDERYRGLIMVHTDVETSLSDVPGLNVLNLRAPSYFENLFYFLPAMRARGVLSSPIAPDAPFETAGTSDIAAVALRSLLELEFRGKVAREVHAQRIVTMREVAQLIGKQLGLPFPVEQVAREADIEALVAAGASRDFATLLNDTWEIFGRHGLLRATAPSASTVVPTAVEDFIRDELAAAIVGSDPTAQNGTAVRPPSAVAHP